MNDERIAKIKLLKRKNKRKNLIKELNFMNFTEEPFLDIKDNELFCKKVFSILNTKENKVQLQGDDYKERIQKSIQLINDTIDKIKVIPKKGRLLFFRETEIEAVLINISEVFNNLDKILELTKFSVGYGDFILVAEDFDYGLCIERTEYFHEFSVWGLLWRDTILEPWLAMNCPLSTWQGAIHLVGEDFLYKYPFESNNILKGLLIKVRDR